MSGYSFLTVSYPLLFAVLLLLYRILPRKCRGALLLLFSVLLYASEGLYALAFLAGVIACVYCGGLGLASLFAKEKTALSAQELTKDGKKQIKKQYGRKRALLMWAVLLLNFAVLALTKFPLLPRRGKLVMPLGLSFFMFQALGYLIDVKMGKIAAEKSLFRFALFVSFFPQLIQGPIGRYKDLTPTLFAGETPSLEDTKAGLMRIVTGYLKKLVLADRLTAALSLLLADTASGAAVALGAFLYAFRLLWDFSGGIDIALGSARMLGITMTENFRAPFLSRDLEEYWTRWHISMGSWFRDYIFYPANMAPRMLRFSAKMRQKFQKGFFTRVPLYISLLLTWLATGVWHGNSWNFVLWGLTNGVILILSEELRPLREKLWAKHPGWKASFGRAVLVTLRTFLLLCLIRLWDCYADPSAVFAALSRLFTAFFAAPLPALGLTALDGILLVLGFAATLVYDLRLYKNRPLSLSACPSALYAALIVLFILVILLFGKYGIGYNAADFIYGKF